MSDETRTARRYHWLSDGLRSFVEEPHAAVCCDARGRTLNLVAAESAPVRSASAELASRPRDVLEALALPSGERGREGPALPLLRGPERPRSWRCRGAITSSSNAT